jgi:hypothetical protein
MIGVDDLWGPEETPEPPKKPKKKPKKMARAAKVEIPKGFRIQLGTCKRRGKDGKANKVPILLAKDPLCWILRIGGHQTYPTSLLGVFQSIAQQESLELNSDATIEDLMEDQRGIEDRIKEMGRILDERIRAHILGKKKKTKKKGDHEDSQRE